MFGLGFAEIIVILIIALLVFGPEKLPEVARTLGRTAGEFRRTLDELKHEISVPDLHRARIELEDELRSPYARPQLELDVAADRKRQALGAACEDRPDPPPDPGALKSSESPGRESNVSSENTAHEARPAEERSDRSDGET